MNKGQNKRVDKCSFQIEEKTASPRKKTSFERRKRFQVKIAIWGQIRLLHAFLCRLRNKSAQKVLIKPISENLIDIRKKTPKSLKTKQNFEFWRFRIQNQLLLEILILWDQTSAPYDEIWLLSWGPKSLSNSQRLFCENYDFASVKDLVQKLTNCRNANV